MITFVIFFKYYFDVSFPKLYITEKQYNKNKWINDELKLKQTKITFLEFQFTMYSLVIIIENGYLNVKTDFYKRI